MKTRDRLILFACLLAAPVLAGDEAARLRFPSGGFSIAPLEGESANQPTQTLMMFLPTTDGFAPNVNVQIQPFTGGIKAYAEVSAGQFKSAGLTVLSEKKADDSATWEYSGKLQGREALHWYARALERKGKVYLVTATASETQWKKVAAKLKGCVDSFRLEKAE